MAVSKKRWVKKRGMGEISSGNQAFQEAEAKKLQQEG
jgi:hypothetical protein